MTTKNTGKQEEQLDGRWAVSKVKCLDCGETFEVRGQARVDLKEHAGPDGGIRLRMV